MPACSAYGCNQRSATAEVSLHRFPKDLERRKKWIAAVRREGFVPSATAVLCSRHFCEEDIDRTSLSVVRIRAEAVPRIFPAFSAHKKKVKNKRKKPRKCIPMQVCNDAAPTASFHACSLDDDPSILPFQACISTQETLSGSLDISSGTNCVQLPCKLSLKQILSGAMLLETVVSEHNYASIAS